jgi:hypothetical protein
MSLFEEPLFGRPSKSGSPQLQENWWDLIDAATRLLYVRVALFILAEPRDPVLGDKPWPLGDNWLSSRYRHSRVSGWQGAYSHAVQDALILVRSELKQSDVTFVVTRPGAVAIRNKTSTLCTERANSYGPSSYRVAAMTSDVPNAAPDPAFFNGRFMVEIREWNWNFYLALSPSAVPMKYRFQRALNYSRGIEIIGRVRAPSQHRAKLMRIWLSPFGPKTVFGKKDLKWVGQFNRNFSDEFGCEFQSHLYLPEEALSPAVTCLSSVWRFLDIWIKEYAGDEAPVSAFSFSASIHPNLKEWAGDNLDDRDG